MMNPLMSIFTGGSDSAPMVPAQPPMATGGSDPLATLARAFLGGGNDDGGLMTPTGDMLRPAWQQELLRTIDPEAEEKNNRRRALLAASQALMSAPGNALQGLGAAAGAGAQQWQAGQDQLGDRRLSVLKTLIDDQAAQRNAGLANEKLLYDRQRDARTDDRADATANSLISYRARQSDVAIRKADYAAKKIDQQIGSTGSGLTYAQRRMANDSILKAVDDFRETTMSRAYTEDDKMAAEQQISEYETRLYERYGLDPDTGNFPHPEQESQFATGILPPDSNAMRVTPGAPGKTDFRGAMSMQSTGSADSPFTPRSVDDLNTIPKGATYRNPADGRLYRKN